MKLSAYCMQCVVNMQAKQIQHLADEEAKSDYLRQVLEIIALSDPRDSAPVLLEKMNRIYEERFEPLPDFTEIKRDYNRLMLGLEGEIRGRIRRAEDPLAMALRYSRAGNYIDFSAQHTVEKGTLLNMLEEDALDPLQEETYRDFVKDLGRAESLVFLLDNCGEIVLDKLALEQIRRQFPGVRCTAFVRGFPVSNDVTAEDAEQVGLGTVARVVSNGSPVAGTDLKSISGEAEQILRRADVILAKGQANYETLKDSGLNIFYLFLAKCQWFRNAFHLSENRGMFVRERS